MMALEDIRVYVDGQLVYFPDQPPAVVNGRTLVPLRFVTEALGAQVEWIADENRINVYTNNSKKDQLIPEPVLTGWSSTVEGIGGIYLENAGEFENMEVKVENLTYPELDRTVVRTGPERRAETVNSQEWKAVEGKPMSIATFMTANTGENLVSPRIEIPLGTVVEFKLTFRRGEEQRAAYAALVYGENDHVVKDGVRVQKERF
jgi:hypothetical protein